MDDSSAQVLPSTCSAGDIYNLTMPTRRIIKSVLHNFLGTYTSRYTDHNGFWLFGLVVDGLEEWEFDLLNDSQSMDTIKSFAATIAAQRFLDQLSKAGLSRTVVRTATLTIKKLRDSVDGQVNSHLCKGHVLEFRASATSDLGRDFRFEAHVFVAPHNPRFEHKSGR